MNISLAQKDTCVFSLSGTITSKNLMPLSYVETILLGTEIKTITNVNGAFKLNNICKGEYIIAFKQFSRIVFKDTIQISSNSSKNYKFDIHALQLTTTEVKVKTKDQSTAKIITLEEEKIDKVKGLPLGTMLEEINGVRSLKTGSSISKPIIHGLHSNRILVLNNGIRQEGQQWGAEHAPEIDPFVSNSISLVKGASSIKYGFDAIGGVVLIEPKKLTDSFGVFGEVNLIGFSNGRQGTASGSLEGRHKKLPSLAWGAQGTYKIGGNVKTPNYYLKNTGIREYNFSGNLAWQKKNYGLDLFYSQFNTNLGIFSGSHIGNLTDLQNAFNLQEPAEKADFTYAIDRPWQHVEHELSTAKFHLNTGDIGRINVVYARQYNLRFEYDKHRPLNDSLAALNNPELQLELTSHTLDVNWKHYELLGLEGEIGISGITQDNTYSGRKFIPNYKNQGAGVYWIEKKKFKKTFIEAGLRYDFRHLQVFMWEDGEIVSPNHNYQDFAGNIGLNYQINKKLNVHLNFAKTWRPPTVSELYSDGVHHGAAAVEIGDDNLTQESPLSSNLDILYKLKKVKFEVSPYFKYFSNYIFLQPQLPPTLTIRGAFPTFEYRESEVRMAGLDFATEINLTKWLTYTVRGSFLRAFNITANDYLIQMPADYLQNIISFQLPVSNFFKESKISIKHVHVAEQNRVPANSDYVAPPESYDLFDIELSTTVPMGKQVISFHLGVANVFNTAYRDYLNRFRYYADEMGRNISLRIKIPISIKAKIK